MTIALVLAGIQLDKLHRADITQDFLEWMTMTMPRMKLKPEISSLCGLPMIQIW